MSGFTGEGTVFENGACQACGAASYGLLSDGPRCHGCQRFVLKDTGATFESAGIEYHAADAPTQSVDLVGIRERIAQVGGTIQIRSRPGMGTLIRAVVPVSGGAQLHGS